MSNEEIILNDQEEYVAAKLMAYCFGEQIHPVILVRALVIDNKENMAWRKEAAQAERITEDQLKKIGLHMMNMWSLTQADLTTPPSSQYIQ